MQKITRFDITKYHIHTKLEVISKSGKVTSFSAILDSGASFTELSDKSLQLAGYVIPVDNHIVKPHQETQKYAKIKLVKSIVLGQELNDWIVYISHFEKSWGIDALIGLDFFRKFEVTVDYQNGHLITKSYPDTKKQG